MNDKKSNRKRRGRNEGSIYQRADGQWTSTISLGYDGNGKRKRKTVYGSTKDEVQKKLRKLQTAADSGRLPEAGSLTIGQYLDAWLAAVKPSLANNSHLQYEQHVKNALKPHLGMTKLAHLSTLHVQKLYADLAAEGVSAAMIRKCGITLGVAIQHAVETLKLIPHNVVRDIKKPKHTAREMNVLSPENVLLFLTEAKTDRLYALYVFFIDSGVRPEEAFALQWNDIRWDESSVAISRALEECRGAMALKELKTKKSKRRIVLTPLTIEALQEHRKLMLKEGNYRPDGQVFCDLQGGFLRKSNVRRRSFLKIIERVNARITEQAEKAGEIPHLLPPLRPYDLRHSSATLLLEAGEDSKVVAERLGHSTTRLTQDTYQHVSTGMQQRAADKLEKLLRPKEQEGQRQKGSG